MRIRNQSLSFLTVLLAVASASSSADQQKPAALVSRPEIFPTLVHPNCSHCIIEGNRRRDELR